MNTLNNQNEISTKIKHLIAACCIGLMLTACNSGEQEVIDLKSAEDVQNAGELQLLDEYHAPDNYKPATTEYGLDAGNGVTATCTTEGWGASEVRELSNVAGLDLNGASLYPGALLRGDAYEQGDYVPVTVPRAPGTIYMTGLTLDKGAQYYADDVEMSGSKVNQAIQELITDYNVQGTTANASYQSEQAYSYEHLLFQLGIDARFGNKAMSTDLSIDSEKVRNYTFVKFTQVFYDIVFEDPELPTSVFRDGDQFADPENQIQAGRPPLYVSKVSYGRMVFFVAESTHEASEVEASLRAAVQGLSGKAVLDSGLTHEQVMARTKVYYYVVGGAAGLALSPIDSATPGEMFSKVKAFIADRQSANFTAANPGAPIAYTLKYLKDRTPAKMSYNIVYDKKDCSFDYPTPVTPTYSFKLELSNIDGEAWVRANDKQITNEYTSAFNKTLDSNLNKTGRTDIEIVLKRKDYSNWGCGRVAMDWVLYKNGVKTNIKGGINDTRCPQYFHWWFSINKQTGEVSAVSNDI